MKEKMIRKNNSGVLKATKKHVIYIVNNAYI